MRLGKRIAITVILFLLFGQAIAYACSPAPVAVWLKCNGEEIRYYDYTSLEITGNFLDESDPTMAAWIANCDQDVTPLREMYTAQVDLWRLNWKGYFRSGDLVFEPYTAEREAALKQSNNRLWTCWYDEYHAVNGWLVLYDTTRSYCLSRAPISGGMCPTNAISSGRFVLELLTFPTWTAGLYLLGLAGFLGVAVWMRRRQWQKKGQGPIVWRAMLALGLALLLIFPAWWTILQLAGWGFLTYTLAAISVWLKAVPVPEGV